MNHALKMECVLTYDLGTSGIKVSLFDSSGASCGSKYVTYVTRYPEIGWHEQNPDHWRRSFAMAIKGLIETVPDVEVIAVSASGQSIGVIPVDAKGIVLLEHVPIWSDARAITQAQRFFQEIDYQSWYDTTGNGFPAHLYAIFKQMWIRDVYPQVYTDTVHFLGTKDYINFLLTDEVATDPSYASGSGAYDLKRGAYRSEYYAVAGIDALKIPQIRGSSETIGTVTSGAAREFGLKAGIPVVCGGVDNACMALGANCYHPGDTYASLGSSAWMTVVSDEAVTNSEKGLFTWAHCVSGLFIPSTGIFASGAALDWAIGAWFSELKNLDSPYSDLDEMANQAHPGAQVLLFLPSLAGGSASDPTSNLRGALVGFDLLHGKTEIARAVLEGIVYHLKAVSDSLESCVPMREEILLVGGGSKSPSWRQIYADIFGKPMLKSRVGQDAASLGAAALAAVGTKFWPSLETIKKAHGDMESSLSNPETRELYAHGYERFLALRNTMAAFPAFFM